MDAAAVTRILFSFHGRMGRTAFWATLIGLAVVGLIEQRLSGWLGGLVGLAMAWVLWASLAKRAHDRGRSVWQVLPAALPFLLGIGWFMILPGIFGAIMGGLIGGAFLLGIGSLLWFGWLVLGGGWILWELGLQPGEPDANDHGAPVGELVDGAG